MTGCKRCKEGGLESQGSS